MYQMNTTQRLTTLSARKIRHYIKMNEIDREKREIERERVRERERERERESFYTECKRRKATETTEGGQQRL